MLSRLISWQTVSLKISEEPVFSLGGRNLADSKPAFVSMELSEPRPDLGKEQSYSCHTLREIKGCGQSSTIPHQTWSTTASLTHDHMLGSPQSLAWSHFHPRHMYLRAC